MAEEIKQKISKMEAKMANMDHSSVMYQQCSDILRTLKGMLPKPKLKIHQDPNDQICESCQ